MGKIFKDTELTVLILMAVIVIVGMCGWVLNIIKLADTCCTVTGMLVVRAFGVIIPIIGAVTGWL